jgi:hypothetical protein
VSFDDPNLVSAAGLLPIMRLAEKAGLRSLADRWLGIPTDNGANAGKKVSSLVGGMVAGADSIDDMALLRHGGMKKIFSSCYPASTWGSFLRSFPPRLTIGWCSSMSMTLFNRRARVSETGRRVRIPRGPWHQRLPGDGVHRHQRPGDHRACGCGKGASGSPRGGARIVADAFKTVTRLPGPETAPVLLRADSRLLRVPDRERGPPRGRAGNRSPHGRTRP